MRKLLQIISLLLIVIGASFFFERAAYAYTDPGTGLLAIQAAGSALVAAGWYLRRKIFSLFHRGSANQNQQESLDSAKDEGEDSRLP